MYWIEKRLEQEEELRQQSAKVRSGVDPLWKSLCQAMKDSIAAYEEKRKFGRFEIDGKNHSVFWVRYLIDTPLPGMEQKKITVTLDSRERSVTASYDKIPFESRTLLLALDKGGEHVRFAKGHGETVTTEDGAAYLLDPFLFPDVAGQSPTPTESVYAKRGILTV